MTDLKQPLSTSTLGKTLNNEQGSVLIISLLIMVVLAMLGAIGSSLSITELQSAFNERRYNQEFYVADGGWQEVPMFLNEQIKMGKDPASINFDPLTTVVKQVNGVPYQLATTDMANSSCGSNCQAFWYQVDAATLEPSDNTTERQRVRVLIYAKYTNTGYGN